MIVARSRAVDTLLLDNPVGSSKLECFISRARAFSFIALTKAGMPPG